MTRHKMIQMIEAVTTPFDGGPSHIQRRWSDAFKAEIAAESLLPGAIVSVIARRVGIATSQIYQWRKQAAQRGWINELVSPPSEALAPPAMEASVIDIMFAGVIIRTTVDSDDAHLRRVIRAVRQTCSLQT